MAVLLPVVADGRAFTVTLTVFVFEHPVLLTVSVSEYVVVALGPAEGLDVLLEESPVDGLQL